MRSSNYEEQIIEILLKNKIDFEREVIFSDFKSMRGGKPRFDFVVYNNNKIQYIIEVDGEQHFHFISKFFKNQSDFKYMESYINLLIELPNKIYDIIIIIGNVREMIK